MRSSTLRPDEVHFHEWSLTRWFSSTIRAALDAKGRGIYREMFDHCMAQGHVPADREILAKICACTPADIEAIWPVLRLEFHPAKRHPERLENDLCTLLRGNFFAFKRKQRTNGAQGGRPKSKGLSEKETTGLQVANPPETLRGEEWRRREEERTPLPPFPELGDGDIESRCKAIVARHPKQKYLDDGIAALRNIVATHPDPEAEIERIDELHEAWCASDDWTKQSGQFAPKLADWLRGCRHDPPPQPADDGYADATEVMRG